MLSVDDFNSSVNSMFQPVVSNALIWNFIKLFLILYGSLASPSMPPKLAPYFTNSYFRIAFMALIIYIADRDASMAIMISVAYFLTLKYLLKNGMDEVVNTGYVSPEVATLITGGTGPSIKPDAVKAAEAQSLQISVSTAAAPPPVALPPTSVVTSTQGGATYKAAPQATLSTGRQDDLSPIPSGVAENRPTLTIPAQSMGVPSAAVPDELHNLAATPVGAH